MDSGSSPRRLTPEEQALVIQWRPYARGYARRWAQYQNTATSHLLDDLQGAAYVGLVCAATKWDPARGSFVGLAIYYMRRELREFMAYYSGAVRRRTNQFGTADFSLQTPVDTNAAGNSGTTFQDRLTYEASDASPDTALDIIAHGRAILDALPAELIARMPLSPKMAARAVEAFMDRRARGLPLEHTAKRWGVTRQRVDQLAKVADAAFAEWAAEIRGESLPRST